MFHEKNISDHATCTYSILRSKWHIFIRLNHV